MFGFFVRYIFSDVMCESYERQSIPFCFHPGNRRSCENVYASNVPKIKMPFLRQAKGASRARVDRQPHGCRSAAIICPCWRMVAVAVAVMMARGGVKCSKHKDLHRVVGKRFKSCYHLLPRVGNLS